MALIALMGGLAVLGGYLLNAQIVSVLRGDAIPRGDTASDRVAVLPFTYRGSEEHAHVGAGAAELLGSKMDGVAGLHSVPAPVILGETAGIGPELDPVAGGEIAARCGANLFVLGSVVEAGGRLHISAVLFDAAQGGVSSSRASAEGEAEDLLEMADELVLRLLAGRILGAN